MDDVRVKLIGRIREAADAASSSDGMLQETIKLIDSFSDGWDWTGSHIWRFMPC